MGQTETERVPAEILRIKAALAEWGLQATIHYRNLSLSDVERRRTVLQRTDYTVRNGKIVVPDDAPSTTECTATEYSVLELAEYMKPLLALWAAPKRSKKKRKYWKSTYGP